MAEGKVTKVKLIAFKDAEYKQKLGEYEVLINPDKVTKKGQLNYSTDMTPIGSSANPVKFTGGRSEKYEFNFFFDCTGIISSKKVDDQVKEIKDLMYTYNGYIHEPNYVKIFWGTQFEFRGRLYSFDQVNTMMDIEGTPLRSEVKAVFIYAVSPEKKELEAGKNSSDLTHIRVVQAGDNLPLMCFRIYGDSSFYIKVAKFNKLNDFRNIKPGDRITFPPNP